MNPLSNVVDETKRLIAAAQAQNLHLRLIGGLAIHLHSPTVAQFGLRREYPDIDFVASRKERKRLGAFFISMGYTADQNFNLLNGDCRQIFLDAQNGRHIDIFVGDFEMCHRLPLRNRLHAHPVTVPLAELFLSKSQIVQLNRKDALDMIALLLDNRLSFDDSSINVDRIARLFLRDWGLYMTTSMNLERIETILRQDDLGLSAEGVHRVLERITTLRTIVRRASKPLLWRLRNRLGRRVRWYKEVEEVDR